jgi:hypothetical protein
VIVPTCVTAVSRYIVRLFGIIPEVNRDADDLITYIYIRNESPQTFTMSTSVLSLAVCLFDGVCTTDFQGPIELLGFISPKALQSKRRPIDSQYAIDTTYLAPSIDPVKTMAGPALVPTRTYASVVTDEQFDIIVVPGGESLSFSSGLLIFS